MIRLKRLTIRNLKNIGTGTLEFPPPDEDGGASLLGIYGQNGSGKSGVIDALEILKTLMSGRVLRPFCVSLIDTNARSAQLDATLETQTGDCTYSAVIGRLAGKPKVLSERFTGGRTVISETDRQNGNGESAIFSDIGRTSPEMLRTARDFAGNGLEIIRTQNMNRLRISPELELPLDTDFELAPQQTMTVRRELRRLSPVLEQFVPGLRMQMSGGEGGRYELETFRDGRSIPFRFESVGVQKIAASLPFLVRAFSSNECTLAADEFDFGINELLFGEILEAFTKFGAGQLIFTSHNLRPLELLEPDQIAFATNDSSDRFRRIDIPGDSAEMRDAYYRRILLGDDELYNRTSPYLISQALYEASIDDPENGEPS